MKPALALSRSEEDEFTQLRRLHKLGRPKANERGNILKRNSRLSLALHALGHMAREPETVRTSAQIAEHAGTNAVVVRRVLGRLREAGLLTSEKGHAGGWQLSRSPQTITIADVYLALDERLVAAPTSAADLHCSIEHSLHTQIAKVLEDAETGLVSRFKGIKITEIAPKR